MEEPIETFASEPAIPPDPPPDAAGAGTPESEAAPRAGESGPAPTGGTSVNTGDLHSQAAAFVAGHQYNDLSTKSFFLEGAERSRLQRRNFQGFAAELVEQEAQHVLCDPEVLEGMGAILESRRVLVVVGPPRSGKATTLRRVASRMLNRHGVREILLCQQILGRDVQVSIDDLTGADKEYRECMVILKDAFAWENTDLLRFVRQVNGLGLETLTRRLHEHRGFLILTADTRTLDGKVQSHLGALGILFAFPAFSSPVLRCILERLAERILSSRQLPKETQEKIRQLLEDTESVEEILTKAQTPPRLEQFVRESLEAVAVGALPRAEGLRRLDDPTAWLLHELPQDLDAWSYVLALILCYAAPVQASIAWLQFDRFRQEVVRVLRRELHYRRDPRSPLQLCREEALRSQAQAVVQPLGFPLGNGIHFEASVEVQQLWSTLLGSGRNLLGILLPHLQRLTESPEADLRSLAARAIGRIGEIAPRTLTFPFLLRRLDGDGRDAQTVGFLLQGVLGSRDEIYRERTLSMLRQAVLDTGPERAEAAILSLRQVGTLDLPLALALLRSALEKHLSKVPETAREKERKVRPVVDFLTAHPETWKKKHPLLSDPGSFLVLEIFEPGERKIFQAVRWTLVGLSFEHDPVQVLRALAAWAPQADANLSPLLALLFLGHRQMADILEEIRLPVSAGPDAAECSLILYWLSPPENDAAFTEVAQLLKAAVLGSARLPSVWSRPLRSRWKSLVLDWLSQAEETLPCRLAVVFVLRQLLSSEEPEGAHFREELFQHLQAQRAAPASSAERKALIATILRPGRVDL